MRVTIDLDPRTRLHMTATHVVHVMHTDGVPYRVEEFSVTQFLGVLRQVVDERKATEADAVRAADATHCPRCGKPTQRDDAHTCAVQTVTIGGHAFPLVLDPTMPPDTVKMVSAVQRGERE